MKCQCSRRKKKKKKNPQIIWYCCVATPKSYHIWTWTIQMFARIAFEIVRISFGNKGVSLSINTLRLFSLIMQFFKSVKWIEIVAATPSHTHLYVYCAHDSSITKPYVSVDNWSWYFFSSFFFNLHHYASSRRAVAHSLLIKLDGVALSL